MKKYKRTWKRETQLEGGTREQTETMLRPSDWPPAFGDSFFHHGAFNDTKPDLDQEDVMAQIQKKREQDKKFNSWESELEKMKHQFMSSTPFKTRLTGDFYDGDAGRKETKHARSDLSQATTRKGQKDNLFRIEFDVYEFDPETVKVTMEGDVLVVEAKQLSNEGSRHRYKREFNRRVHVPQGTNSDRLICKLSASGILTAEVPAPPSYSEAFKDCKDIPQSPTGSDYDNALAQNTDEESIPEPVPSTPTFVSSTRVPVSTPRVSNFSTSAHTSENPRVTRISREDSTTSADPAPTFPRRTKIIREYETTSDGTSSLPRQTRIVREYTQNDAHTPDFPQTSRIPDGTQSLPRHTKIIREYEQNGEECKPSTPKRTEIIREYKTTTEDNPVSRKATRGNAADSDHSYVVSPRQTATTHEFESVSKKSTPSTPRHTEIIREYETVSSPRLTRITRHVVPSTENFVKVSSTPRFKSTISSRDFTPTIIESSRSTRKHTPREYTPTPSTKRYTLGTVRHSPSKTYEYISSTTDSIPNHGTTYMYAPTKYSTLPSKTRQKNNRIIVERSHSHAVDPKWRSGRQPRISLSDSVDSEATLSSSPSDDLYQGHSSFSDLDA